MEDAAAAAAAKKNAEDNVARDAPAEEEMSHSAKAMLKLAEAIGSQSKAILQSTDSTAKAVSKATRETTSSRPHPLGALAGDVTVDEQGKRGK